MATTRRIAGRVLRWTEVFLLGAGLSALFVWAASIAIPAALNRWDSAGLHQGAASRRQAKNLATNQLVGRLTIPRLHLSSMVREGDGEATLSLALGHIPGTALPGERGNVGVAGHRDELFRGLRNIRQNDEIRFETSRGDYVYQVERTRVVKPAEVSVLQARQRPELTLVTCYPFYYIGSAPDRFIVQAREIAAPPRAR